MPLWVAPASQHNCVHMRIPFLCCSASSACPTELMEYVWAPPKCIRASEHSDLGILKQILALALHSASDLHPSVIDADQNAAEIRSQSVSRGPHRLAYYCSRECRAAAWQPCASSHSLYCNPATSGRLTRCSPTLITVVICCLSTQAPTMKRWMLHSTFSGVVLLLCASPTFSYGDFR